MMGDAAVLEVVQGVVTGVTIHGDAQSTHAAVSSTAEVMKTGGETVIRVHDGDNGTPKKPSPRVSRTSPVKTTKWKGNKATGKRKQRSIKFGHDPLAPVENISENNEELESLGPAEYELRRLESIGENNVMLKSLGLGQYNTQPEAKKKRQRKKSKEVYTPQYKMNNRDIKYVSEALLSRKQHCDTDPMPFDEFVAHIRNAVSQTPGSSSSNSDSTWQSAIINTGEANGPGAHWICASWSNAMCVVLWELYPESHSTLEQVVAALRTSIPTIQLRTEFTALQLSGDLVQCGYIAVFVHLMLQTLIKHECHPPTCDEEIMKIITPPSGWNSLVKDVMKVRDMQAIRQSGLHPLDIELDSVFDEAAKSDRWSLVPMKKRLSDYTRTLEVPIDGVVLCL
jgi:hypothetical protein